MKVWLVYWLIGCFMMGNVIISNYEDCPYKLYSGERILIGVAIWPAYLYAGYKLKSRVNLMEKRCE